MNVTVGEDPRWLERAREVAGWSGARFRAAFKAAGTQRERDALLRARFRFRRLEFARYCLPEVVYAPWNDYHRDALDGAPDHWIARRTRGETRRNAHAAPRGIAKSTIAKIGLLHRLCYGLEGFVVVLSATVRDAGLWSRSIRQWCERPPPALARLYGPIVVDGALEQFRVSVQGRRSVAILSLSYGTAIRGINDATIRPTLVVLDDAEDRKKVLNPAIREEWQGFLTSDVLKLGFREGGLDVEWRGTVLHPDAILARLIRGTEPNAGWDARRYQALVRWPKRSDLWEECGRIYCDLSRGDTSSRRAAAFAFYEEHRGEMDEGVEVLDAYALPVFRCYETMWAEGLPAFLREMQNEPRDPSTALFDSSRFARCRLIGQGAATVIERLDRTTGKVLSRVPLSECRTVIRWDPSLGGVGGDYAAIVALARDRHGYTYVIAVWMRREKPTAQLAALWAMAEGLGIQRASLEGNGFQSLLGEDFIRERDRRKREGLWWQLVVEAEPSTTDKEQRIAALDVPITNGWLCFADNLPREYLGQWDAITGTGSTDHDDGPDATEGAYVRLGGVAPEIRPRDWRH